MIKKFLLLFLLGLNTYATIFVEVVMTHEKDFEGQTILMSELHFIENIQPEKMSRFVMKSKIDLLLSGQFVDSQEIYGPGAMVKIEGRVLSKTLSKSFELNLKLGTEGDVVFSEPELGQKTKIKIKPVVH
ncbi:hypothetical protein ACRXCV_15845 [Halobacteriovorax sp. GFR7]|uniref:hypothetical protein n=3 Tax=Halobacteriovorax TaxID=1652133 RepID=UPI003717CDFD